MSYFFHAAILLALGFISYVNFEYGKAIMSTQQAVDAVVAQLSKAKEEILSKVADLNAQIEDAGVADVVDTSELTAVAQALDDIVPDEVSDDVASDTVEDTVE